MSLALRGSPPAVKFEYAFYTASAKPDMAVVDLILTPRLIEIATSSCESGFTSEFKDRLAENLGHKRNERIEAVSPRARPVLRLTSSLDRLPKRRSHHAIRL
jgi:hypothetical protein